MAFKKLRRPGRSHASPISISIGTSSNTRQTWLSLSKGAHRALGEPAAIHLEWDDEDCLLRVVASSPDDRDAYPITKSNLRVSVTGIVREMGWDATTTRAFPGRRESRTSIIADLSDMPMSRTLGLVA